MKMNQSMVRKLDEAFMQGMSDREACLYCGIAYSTFTSWLENNPDYRIKKELLKDQPKMKAKHNISKSINNGDINTSKWYLERRSKEEFGTKEEIDTKVTFKSYEQLLKEIKQRSR